MSKKTKRNAVDNQIRILVKDLLSQSSFWLINKKLAKKIGFLETCLLSIMMDADTVFESEDNWFYQTSDTIESFMELSYHKQQPIIKNLIKLGILEQKNKGVPMKRYFRINFNAISQIITKEDVDKLESNFSNNSKTKIENNQNNKEHSNKENNYKDNSIKSNTIKKEPLKIEYPQSLNDPLFIDTYNQWIKYRREIKKPLSKSTIDKQLLTLSNYSIDIAILMINRSIENGWTGIFELNGTKQSKPKQACTSADDTPCLI